MTYYQESTTNPIHLKQTKITPNGPMDAKSALVRPAFLAIIPVLVSISSISVPLLSEPKPPDGAGPKCIIPGPLLQGTVVISEPYVPFQ